MYQSGRAGDEAKKRKSPAKSGRVGITVNHNARPSTHNAQPTHPHQLGNLCHFIFLLNVVFYFAIYCFLMGIDFLLYLFFF